MHVRSGHEHRRRDRCQADRRLHVPVALVLGSGGLPARARRDLGAFVALPAAGSHSAPATHQMGELAFAVEVDADGVPHATCNRAPARAEVWHGLVFVNADLDALSLAETYPALEEICAEHPFEIGDRTPVALRRLPVAANWKIWVENASECYHCPTIHQHSFSDAYEVAHGVYEYRNEGKVLCQLTPPNAKGTRFGLAGQRVPLLVPVPVHVPADGRLLHERRTRPPDRRRVVLHGRRLVAPQPGPRSGRRGGVGRDVADDDAGGHRRGRDPAAEPPVRPRPARPSDAELRERDRALPPALLRGPARAVSRSFPACSIARSGCRRRSATRPTRRRCAGRRARRRRDRGRRLRRPVDGDPHQGARPGLRRRRAGAGRLRRRRRRAATAASRSRGGRSAGAGDAASGAEEALRLGTRLGRRGRTRSGASARSTGSTRTSATAAGSGRRRRRRSWARWDDAVGAAERLGAPTLERLEPEEVARRAGLAGAHRRRARPERRDRPAGAARARPARAWRGSCGVRIHEHSPRDATSTAASRPCCARASGALTADRVVIATNAWAAEHARAAHRAGRDLERHDRAPRDARSGWPRSAGPAARRSPTRS